MTFPCGKGRFGVLWLAALAGWLGVNAAEPLEKPRHTPTQRMTRARLAAADEAIHRLASRRRTIPPIAGLTDFRCSFHAHAEDASHTGGTRPEMLSDALRAGMHCIFLSDHFRPPRDFMDSWRMKTNGILFIPGSEWRGFLVHPAASVMAHEKDATPEFVEVVTRGDGMLFLSHIEERADHPMEGLTGLEIYNRHYDAKRDVAGMLALVGRLTDPAGLEELRGLVRDYPDGVLSAQVEYPQVYLDKWDSETAVRRLTGVGANDCHHNQVFILHKQDEGTARIGTIVDKPADMRSIPIGLRPGVAKILAGKAPGESVILADFDPYYRAFRCVTTHVLAEELEERSLRVAVRNGRVYVAHEWMGDPTGFRIGWVNADSAAPAARARAWMGEERPFAPEGRIDVESPMPGRIRLIRNGTEIARGEGDRLQVPITASGVYRAEVWLELDGEWRPWIYSNPIYLR